MSATLQLTRPSSLVDLVWPYAIDLDGETVWAACQQARETYARSRAWRPRPPRIRSRHIVLGRLGFSSPLVTFEASEGQTAAFRCHPRKLREVPYRLMTGLAGKRTTWIELEPS